MNPQVLPDLTCPESSHEFGLEVSILGAGGAIREGALVCKLDGRRIPIRNGIPRFREDSGYAASFGAQWNRFRRTQLDKFKGTTLSHNRFYSGTGWTPEELSGKRVLEAGCGAGRFTQVLLDAGARVYSLDYSNAVDAAYANNGPEANLCMDQADIYSIPFHRGSFDYVFCYGVLQHTPDPKRAFMNLATYVKPGGKIAIDVYRKGWELEPYKSKYLYRPITKRLPRRILSRLLEFFIPLWLPFDTLMKKIPIVGPALGMLVPCWNYSYLPLSKEQKIEWSILDTFDALSPQFDLPQTEDAVRQWFSEARLSEISVCRGGNGVLGNGVKC